MKTAEKGRSNDQHPVVQAQLSEDFLLYIAELCQKALALLLCAQYKHLHLAELMDPVEAFACAACIKSTQQVTTQTVRLSCTYSLILEPSQRDTPALPDSALKQCPKATIRMGSCSSMIISSMSRPPRGTSAVPVRHRSDPSNAYTCRQTLHRLRSSMHRMCKVAE